MQDIPSWQQQAAWPPPPGWHQATPPPTPTAPPVTMSRTTREDLKATLAARRDLGPEYEDALVESFLDKLDHEITARVRNEVANNARYGGRPAKEDRDRSVAVALGSLGIGVPLTAIAGGITQEAGGAGILVAWIGIIAVNVAYAVGRRRRRE